MKKLLLLPLALVIGFLSVGTTGFAAPEDNNWSADYGIYARTVAIMGNTLSSSDKGFVGAMFMRYRPFVNMKKGGFEADFTLGADVYFGSNLQGASTPGGGGAGLSPITGGRNQYQLLQANIGYNWGNGVYANAGVSHVDIPFFMSDYGNPGAKIGWKNDTMDVNLFYYQLTMGDIFKGTQGGGYFGIMGTFNVKDVVTFNPFIVALYQRKNVYQEDPTSGDPNSYNYTAGGKFVGGIGILPGIAINYQSESGIFTNATVIAAFGHNDVITSTDDGSGTITTTRHGQKRVAVGALVEVGYKLDQLFSVEAFVDFRSGSSNANTSGTNSSINGALLEYDAISPPLYILYNAGNGRLVPAYAGTPGGDGFAFSDRGAITFGATGSVRVSDFEFGINLGYGFYAAGSGSKNMGFELDLNPKYHITDELGLYIEAGVLFPGQGVKSLVTGKTRIPYLINIGMIFS
jgi:hypothetical protein